MSLYEHKRKDQKIQIYHFIQYTKAMNKFDNQ